MSTSGDGYGAARHTHTTAPQYRGKGPGLGIAVLAGALAFSSLPARAIVLNDQMAAQLPGPGSPHDKVAHWYDQTNSYPAVASLYNNISGAMCTGGLINHRTVLTAAHCLIDDRSSTLFPDLPGTMIGFGPSATTSSVNDQAPGGAMAHPDFVLSRGASDVNDIGMASLKNPVTGIQPILLLQLGQALPVPGSLVQIAGYGEYGAATGAHTADGRRRIGDTTIGTIGPSTFVHVNLIQVEFRDPADPNLYNYFQQTAPVPARQSQPAPGDSGGPMFMVMADGSLIQIGVLSTGNPHYGGLASYASISFNRDWIDENNPLRYVSAEAGLWKWSDAQAWTDAGAAPGAARVAPDNHDGSITAQPYGVLGRYYEVYVSNASHITLDKPATIDRLVVANSDARIDIPLGSQLGVVLDATLNAGRLTVDGVLFSGQFNDPTNQKPSFHQYGGTISGTGRIVAGSGFMQHGGVIAPGAPDAPGVLTIEGDYVQAAAATLAVRVDDQAGSDRLEVTGRASLAGKLAVSFLTNAPAQGQRFVILQAGALSGDFSNIDITLPAFTWTTTIAGNQIILSSGRIDYSDDVPLLPGIAPATRLSALNSARALNRIAESIPADAARAAAASVTIGQVPFPTTPALAIASLNTMDKATLGAALLALPPAGFHAQSAFGVTTSRLVSGVIFERLASRDGNAGASFNAIHGAVDAQSAPFVMSDAARRREPQLLPGHPGQIGALAPLAPEPGLTPFGLFVAGSYLSSGAVSDTPYTAGAVTAGLDYRLTSSFTLGAAITYVEDSRRADGMKFDSHAVAPALYGRFSTGRFFVDAYLGYAFSDSSTRRIIPFGDQTLVAEAAPRAGQFLAGAIAGVKLDAASLGAAHVLPTAITLTPLIGLDVSRNDMDAYVERGAGALAIGVAARQFADLRATAGLELTWDMPFAGGVLTPHVKMSVTQRFGDNQDSASASYMIAPELPFRLAGPSNARTYGTLGAGLAFRITEALSARITGQSDVGPGGFLDSRLTAKAQYRI